MAIRVGINGFGRIGRCAFRAMEADRDIEVVAINDLGKTAEYAHLLKYDSMHGRVFDKVVPTGEGFDIDVDGHVIKGLSERDPEKLPWGELDIDVVLESTGVFRTGETAGKHLAAGARKVIISAPSKGGEDITIVPGVNHTEYDPAVHHVISGASCTTNCLAPIVKVLHDAFGVEKGYVNTIHSYTNDQLILDGPHKKDLRRSRAAFLSQIPTTTGAAKTTGVVLHDLARCLDGMATRVPTPTGSMVDLVSILKRPVTPAQINEAMRAAAEGPLKGILRYETDPIVSSDIIGDTASSIFDSNLTMVLGGEGDFCKVISWYDNEAGYSQRMADLAKFVIRGGDIVS